MSSYLKMIQRVSSRFHNLINKKLEILSAYLGIVEIFYYKITNEGHFVLVDSKAEWAEYYGDRELYLIDPYFRHPRFFQEGVILLKDVQSDSLQQIHHPLRDKFHVSTVLKLLNKIPNGIEVFGFCSSRGDENQVSLMLSELPLLRLFSKRLREENRPLFSFLEENLIDFRDLVGSVFDENSLEAKPRLCKESFLKELGIENPLTERETDVMRLLVKGFSASQIGREIFLSPRTVEHHLERMKDKLECDSRAELIQKARELEDFGCLCY